MTGESRIRSLAHAGIIGPVWFTTMIVLQGVLHPAYSHVKMPISALAAFPTGWMQNLNFYVAGLLFMVFAVALHADVRPAHRRRAGFALLLVGGAGLAMNGMFPWEMTDGVPAEPPAHAASAITTFLATGTGMILFSRRMKDDERWRNLAAYTWWSGVIVLLLFVIVGAFAIDEGAPLHEWTGLIQRALVAVWFLWAIVVSLRLRLHG